VSIYLARSQKTNVMEHKVHLRLPPLPLEARTPCVAASTPVSPDAAHVLDDFIQSRCPAVTPEEQHVQVRALGRLQALFKSWAGSRAFCMFVAGSFRLGVHTRTADIDVLFVTTRAITHADVFTQFVAVLQGAAEVSHLQPVARARVPLIGLTIFGQEFDMLTCHLRTDVLPSRDALLHSYEWMNGLSDADVLAFNGPRVTEMIPRALQQPHAVFTRALRLLRHWAKQRFVYSNKSGYLGGVNLALMLCFVAQRAQPRACALELILRFFDTFATWDAKKPVVLDAHVPHACPAWLAHLEWRSTQPAALAVLTPCFPRFNTTYTTSQFSFKVMQREFVRGARILRTTDPTALSTCCTARLAALCCPLEPVRTCARFLNVRVTAPATAAGKIWLGYIEAQTRHLIEYLSREQLAVAEFRYLPVWCTAPVLPPPQHSPDSSNNSSVAVAHCCRQTFITADDDGKIRPFVVSGTLSVPLAYFIETHAAAGPPRPADSNITLAYCSRAELPPDLFHVLHNEELTPEVLVQLEHTPSRVADASMPTSSRLTLHDAGGTSIDSRIPSTAKASRARREAGRKASVLAILAAARARVHAARTHTPWSSSNVKRVQATPAGVIVRPYIVHRQQTVPFDVYVCQDARLGGCIFKATEWSPPAHVLSAPDMQSAYAHHLQTMFTREALANISNRRIACWCTGVACTCHAHILLQTARRAHAQLQQERRCHAAARHTPPTSTFKRHRKRKQPS
jgi:poly(A) polymerase